MTQQPELRIVPVTPTDEMLRVSLATDLPATYRDHLRHPMNGEKTAREVEKAIENERKRWSAMLSAAPQPAPGEMREVVARLVDPVAFVAPEPNNIATRGRKKDAQFIAFAKADAILSALGGQS